MNKVEVGEKDNVAMQDDLYLEKERVRHMSQGGPILCDEEVQQLIEEAKVLGTDRHATPMSLERARSINLDLARHFLHAAGNLEHVIWEFGGHRSCRYNPGLDPLAVEKRMGEEARPIVETRRILHDRMVARRNNSVNDCGPGYMPRAQRKGRMMDAKMKEEIDRMIIGRFVDLMRMLIDRGQIPAVTIDVDGTVIRRDFSYEPGFYEREDCTGKKLSDRSPADADFQAAMPLR